MIIAFWKSAEPLDPLLATQKAVIKGIEPGQQQITSVPRLPMISLGAGLREHRSGNFHSRPLHVEFPDRALHMSST